MKTLQQLREAFFKDFADCSFRDQHEIWQWFEPHLSTPGTTEGEIAYIEMDHKVLPEDSSDVFVIVGKEKVIGCYEGDGWWTDTYGPRTEITSWLKPVSPSMQIGEVSDWVAMLKEFHTAFDLPIREEPTENFPVDEFQLRHKILKEEVEEIDLAYYWQGLPEIFDGILDSLYILIGTAIQMGFGDYLNAGFREVHRSNMSKLDNDGNPILREDGKVMKGPNFSPPDLKVILTKLTQTQESNK